MCVSAFSLSVSMPACVWQAGRKEEGGRGGEAERWMAGKAKRGNESKRRTREKHLREK